MTGILMIIPVIFSTLLMIPHWWKNEKEWWKKLFTFIFIPVYPQYRALRILFLAWCCCCFGGGEQAVQEKERFDDTVSFVGEYIFSHLVFQNTVIVRIRARTRIRACTRIRAPSNPRREIRARTRIRAHPKNQSHFPQVILV